MMHVALLFNRHRKELVLHRYHHNQVIKTNAWPRVRCKCFIKYHDKPISGDDDMLSFPQSEQVCQTCG